MGQNNKAWKRAQNPLAHFMGEVPNLIIYPLPVYNKRADGSFLLF